MELINQLRDAITAASTPIIMAERQQLLGDFAFIASTLGTTPDDDGSYITIVSPDTPAHNLIGLTAILSDNVSDNE